VRNDMVSKVHIVYADGVLLRELTLDPSRDYQPLGTPKVVLDVLRQVSGTVLRQEIGAGDGDRTRDFNLGKVGL
jgi:hypothetical protein